MLKFFASTLYIACLLPIYLEWSRTEIERQLDRMQEAVFNSPGVEAPITPTVVVGGMTLVTSHLVIARTTLHLSVGKALLSLVLGGMLGFLGWQQWQRRDR